VGGGVGLLSVLCSCGFFRDSNRLATSSFLCIIAEKTTLRKLLFSLRRLRLS
jgi:hypothetical protein